MDNNILPEAEKDYLSRSGDTELSTGHVETDDEHGFCIWRMSGEYIVLVNVYGDGNYWNNWIEIKAKELGYSKILFATKRNPAGFIRKHGFKVTGHILERDV